MPVKSVRIYQTSDNAQHTNRDVATQHENTINSVKLLAGILQASLSTCRPEAILKQMLLESPAIRDILLKYERRTPKSQKAR